MKPATEILKNSFSRIRELDPEEKIRMIQNNRRKRRFKPKKPVRLPEVNEIKDFKTRNKTSESVEKVPGRFSNVLMTRAKVEEHDQNTDTSQLKSPISDTFETTNMERNRVVLFKSSDNNNANNATLSLEVESEPKYSLSTTSRTFSEVSMENMKLSEDAGNQSKDSNEAGEVKAEDRAGQGRGPANNGEMNHVINVGLSIEEVERAAERKSVDNNSMKDMADPALYRFEYRVLSDTDVGGDDLDEFRDNSFMSLNTLSPDGLYHPENAPTYEQLLEVDDDVLLQFDEKFGIRNENFLNHPETQRSQEIVEKSSDSEAESMEKVSRKTQEGDREVVGQVQYPLGQFRNVENYPVPVPRDYPGDFTNNLLSQSSQSNLK